MHRRRDLRVTLRGADARHRPRGTKAFATVGLRTLVVSRRLSCARTDHGVQRVREKAAGIAVEAKDVAEVSCLVKVAFDEAHVASVVEAVPDLDHLRRKTAVSMFHKRRTTPPVLLLHSGMQRW